ncbi:MAG: hypothetical protein KHX90_09995 [Veillonella sp.]|uniref:hypothetical protein n=1 Tax=Veillonella sp. TaxID=1926307 RepID=UPI00257DF511|nr:hypothetical protein [Veillonella sp.]MBS5353691.1 hypothetical protein [Veillonella sp.]
MKKSTMLAFTAALLMSAASITGHAASAPTYDDNLILPNPASAPGLSNVVLVPVASPQVVQSLHDYNEKDGFVNSYGYNVLRGMVDRINEVVQHQKQVGGPMTDDEAQALEDAILDILAQEQEHVSNEELRHYMNETIWFAAKETVKNKASEEPTAADEHVVDLRKAINEPMGSNDYNKVDLRSAIQQ